MSIVICDIALWSFLYIIKNCYDKAAEFYIKKILKILFFKHKKKEIYNLSYVYVMSNRSNK